MSFYFKKRKRLLKRFLVGASLFIVGASVIFILSFLPKSFFGARWIAHPLFPIFLMALICIGAYKPLDFFYTEIFKRYLFKRKSFIHMSLIHLVEELRLILDLEELANLVVNTFGEVLHLKTVALVVPHLAKDSFEIISGFGWSVTDYRKVHISQTSPLISLIQESGPHVLVRNSVIRAETWQEANQLAHDFDILQAGWIVPLFLKEDLLGLLAFSAVQPDRTFDKADFHFFREFAVQLAKNVHNTLKVRELKVANLELQDTQSRLVQSAKLSAIEQLATGLAHEIHNPLTIISGKAQILLLQKDRAHLDERVEEVLRTIVKQTKRAADITRKLLMFSQGSGAPKEMLRLEQVLQDTLALVSYQTSLEGIELTQSIRPNIPRFYANVHEIREVFLNLILNAVQSVGSKGGGIHVEVRYLAREGLIEIQVSDTGRGIEKEHIEKLFNPFFSTRHDALGLGLFVTKQIIHRYGGSIRVESRAGEGSLFIVCFPHTPTSGPLSTEENSSFSSLFLSKDQEGSY